MPKGSHILLADDDENLVEMYGERLKLSGYKVTIARNGEEALQAVEKDKPDIILLDVMMPKLDGYGTLSALKSDPKTKDIPVVMLSALIQDLNMKKASEWGADEYLVKSETMPGQVVIQIEKFLTKK